MNVKTILLFLVVLVVVTTISACSVSSDIATGNYFEFDSETGAIIKYHPRGIEGDLKLISDLIVPNEIDGVKVRSIRPHAFNYETELKSIVLSEYITEIDDFAFYGCKALTKVIMGDQVVKVGDSAFYGCESLKAVTFGSNVESIGKDAFNGARAMTAIVLPDQLKQIGEGAFWGLRNVERIDLGNGLETIGKYAFFGVGSYEGIELVIPQSIKYIGESAFSNIMIKQVYFHAEDVTFEVEDSDLMSETLITKLSGEDNPVGYYYMEPGTGWIKVPLDALKTPVDFTRIMVIILGIYCLCAFFYLLSGKQHVLGALWELVPFTLVFIVIIMGLKINPLGELVADFSVPYPIYFGFLVGLFGMNLINRYTYICYNWSYNDAIQVVNDLMKKSEVEFQREEEAPGGKYSFVFKDLNRIYLTKGFGEVRIDMKEIKGLSLPKEIIKEMKKNSSPNWGLKLSSSAIRYLAIGLLLLSYIF